MEKSIGSRLGPYEIAGFIGAGGMGEVYRAYDSRLKREVAIKIISENGFPDPEVRKRFLFEAQTASALNHPNILVVYDVGEENQRPYIVSELVEGDNLRKLLQKGSLPIRTVLDIAVQTANGLSTAHRAGIVHRDLKPENIMITSQGHVKILDFGLAKLRPGSESDGQTQTLSRPLSEAGVRHGTVPYMSPEQASGEEIDYRSDQFSFGCILYEMLTGKCAFLRESAPRTLVAILSEEPPPVSESNPRVPPPLRWVMERCLSKDAKQRYDSTFDLYRELAHLRDHLSEAINTDKILPLTQTNRGIKKVLFIAVPLLLALAFIFLLANRQTNKVDLRSYKYVPFETGPPREFGPEWSPDGKTIAYAAKGQIYTKHLDSWASGQITHSDAPCGAPFWSPDGSRIYFISDYKGKPSLWWIGGAGGKSDVLIENVTAATISLKDKTLALLREENNLVALWLWSPKSKDLRKFMPETLANKNFASGRIKFSPDGSKIGLLASTRAEASEFWVISYPDGEARRYLQDTGLEGPSPGVFSWMPNNYEIVFEQKNLWIADLKKDRSRAITLTRGQLEAHRHPSISPDGKKIAFVWFQQNSDILEIPINGSSSKLHPTTMYESSPVWSPQGKSYVFATDQRGTAEIWLRDTEEGTQRPLITRQHFGSESDLIILDSPSFSPDGQRIAFQRGIGRSIDLSIWFTTLAGGQPVRLTKNPGNLFQDSPTWSPDGNWIAYSGGLGTESFLAKSRVGIEQESIIIKKGAVYYKPVWSPKGDWITFQSREGAAIVSPDGKKTEWLSRKQWTAFCWSKDGSVLYGIISENNHALLKSINLQSRQEKLIADLGSFQEHSQPYWSLSLDAEEEVFVTTFGVATADIWILEGF